ncbi:MAG TPA: META domain-containing protein [Acidimicrobiia bacterium]
MRRALVFAAVLGLTLAACADASEPGADPTLSDWTLQSGTVDGTDIPIVADHPITLTFEADNAIAGSSACNSYFGGYTIEGADISFTEMGSTMMACEPAEVMDSEGMYLDAMSKVDAFTATEDSLTLTGDGVELVFAADA